MVVRPGGLRAAAGLAIAQRVGSINGGAVVEVADVRGCRRRVVTCFERFS